MTNRQSYEQNKRENRTDQQDQEKEKTIDRDISLADLKRSYEEELIDIKQYQKGVRRISYTYIDALDQVIYNDDSH